MPTPRRRRLMRNPLWPHTPARCSSSPPAMSRSFSNWSAVGSPWSWPNLESDLPITATWVDHRKATESAVRMLASVGHRRIAYVGRTPDHLFYGQAYEGYRRGLARAGLSPAEQLAVFSRADDAMRAHSAYEATQRLLAHSSAAPTAFVPPATFSPPGCARPLATRAKPWGAMCRSSALTMSPGRVEISLWPRFGSPAASWAPWPWRCCLTAFSTDTSHPSAGNYAPRSSSAPAWPRRPGDGGIRNQRHAVRVLRLLICFKHNCFL